jgi:iron complex transport system substrate-binding protein
MIGTALLFLLSSIATLAQPQSQASRIAPAAAAQASTPVTDEIGRTVKVPAEAQRIVSLAPNLTETVFALGKGDILSGDTDFCDFPPAAAQKQHVGGPVNPNLEQIVLLRPDLILAAMINRRETVDALERLGLPVYVSDPHTVDEMVSSTERLGGILHAEAVATPLVDNLRARLAELDRRLSGTTPRRVLFVVWSDPLISMGRETFLADALRRAGAQSVIQTAEEWPRISLESVAASQPEYLIFAPDQGDEAKPDIDALRVKPGWRDLDAVKQGNIIVISDAINRPTPRMVDAIEQLARALHPDVFAAGSASGGEFSRNKSGRDSKIAAQVTPEACACVR